MKFEYTYVQLENNEAIKSCKRLYQCNGCDFKCLSCFRALIEKET